MACTHAQNLLLVFIAHARPEVIALLLAGLDSAELISQLRAAHAEDNTRMGVDVVLGKAGDMADLGIYECFRVRIAFPQPSIGHLLPFVQARFLHNFFCVFVNMPWADKRPSIFDYCIACGDGWQLGMLRCRSRNKSSFQLPKPLK